MTDVKKGSAVRDTAPLTDLWIGRSRLKQDGDFRLFCLPFAGSGVAMFANWPKSLPGSVEVWPIQMPGREARVGEPPFRNMRSLVTLVAEILIPHLEKPFAFFGHSMGAMISFELARELRRCGASLPGALLLSGRPAPHLARRSPRYNLPEEQFLQEVLALNGDRDVPADESELMRLMLPTIRADFEICETSEYVDEMPLDCPFTVWGALRDPETSVMEAAAWRDQTTASFTLRIFDGNHFFPITGRPFFMKSMAEEMERLVVSAAPVRPAHEESGGLTRSNVRSAEGSHGV